MVTSTTSDVINWVEGYDGALTPNSRVRQISSVLTPTKVNGTVITLPGGGKFRKATPRDACTSKLIFESINEHRSWDDTWKRWMSLRTGPGGIRPDLVFTNMSLRSPSGAQSSTTSSPTIPSGMRNEAVTKALLKIADQKVNLAENLATAGQTVRLFTGAAQSLSEALKQTYRDKSVRQYLTKSFRQLRRDGVSRTVSDRYLEYVYGWKPLVQDVFALYKLATEHVNLPLLIHATGMSKRQGQSSGSSYYDGSLNNTTEIIRTTESARVLCSIWARLDPDWQGARALNQLGLLNPASLVWELTPWSFVVDWVLPIGSVLSALTAPAGLIFVDGSLSVRTSCSSACQTSSWRWFYNDPRWATSTPAKFTHLLEGYHREVLGNWPLPGLWIDPDPFRGDRSAKALALSLSNLKGMRKSTMG